MNGYSWRILLFCIMALFSCDAATREELYRIRSPDSLVDAVVIQTNAGATTSYVYELFIVKVGGKPQHGEELFRADHVDDLKIKWLGRRVLEIRYKEARIFHFSNFWSSKDVQNFNYVVELQLVQSQ